MVYKSTNLLAPHYMAVSLRETPPAALTAFEIRKKFEDTKENMDLSPDLCH